MITGATDTLYYDMLNVERNGRFVVVKNREVHVDSLRRERVYKEGGYPSFFTLQFVKDSMYYFRWLGGQGGNGSTLWSCKKSD